MRKLVCILQKCKQFYLHFIDVKRKLIQRMNQPHLISKKNNLLHNIETMNVEEKEQITTEIEHHVEFIIEQRDKKSMFIIV